jgi:hypothetical protein
MKKLTALLLICVSLPVRAEITPRYRADGTTWTMGAQTVFVDAAQPWSGRDLEHDHAMEFSSNLSFVSKWDFESCTAANASGDLQISCTGLQLPNGTEVWFGSTSLPTGLVSFWSNRRKSYYVVSASAAASLTATGTIELAHTPGGASIAYTDATGSGSIKMQFAGYRVATVLDVPQNFPLNCDHTTDICNLHDGAGTPVTHSYVTSGTQSSFNIYAGSGGTIPTPAVVRYGGSNAKFCVDPINTTTFYLRRQYNFDGTCPVNSAFYYPNKTTSITCTSGTNDCSRVADFQDYMRFKIISVESGALGAEVSLNTEYQSSIGNGAGPNAFSFHLPVVDDSQPNIVFTSTFTATAELIYQDFSDSGTAPYYASRSTGSNHFIRDITGEPAGTTFNFRFASESNTASGSQTATNGYSSIDVAGGRVTIIMKVPAITAAGTYPITIYFDESSSSSSGAWGSASYNLYAVTLSPLTRGSLVAADFTAVPNLATWEDRMVSSTNGGGSATSTYPRCPSPRSTVAEAGATITAGGGAPGSLSNYQTNWFYDGAYGFGAIADWSPTTRSALADQVTGFRNCADWIADDLADEYMSATAHEAINWMPAGLYSSYGRGFNTAARKYNAARLRDALLAMPAMDHGHKGATNDYSQRELSFIADRQFYAYMINRTHNPKLVLAVDIIIGWLYDKAQDRSNISWDEPFMMGLSERTLTNYYKHYFADPRIPVVLKMIADKFYDDWYNTSNHKMLYNPYGYGERCNSGCQGEVTSVLNGMVGATFAWVWRFTGDSTYRDRFDELIGNNFATENPFDAKAFNQAYSYRGVKGMQWRQGLENPF